MGKGLKLKVRKFLGLIPTFVEVTGEKLVGAFLPPPILNRVKEETESKYPICKNISYKLNPFATYATCNFHLNN